jgi:hypothetical protein
MTQYILSRSVVAMIACALVLVFVDVKCAAGVGHSHHMKRQQQSLVPQLTLDVEPHHGIEPTNLHTPVPEYHFSQDSNLLFNFTCTIKHPSYKYKLTMTKEQVFHSRLLFFFGSLFFNTESYKFNRIELF